MGVDVHLGEGVIVLRIGSVLVDPARLTLGSHDRNLVGAAGSCDHVRSGTDDVLTFKCLNQGVFIFIRYKVSALGVSSFGKDVADTGILGAHAVPEGLPVGIGRTALLLISLGVFRLCGDGGVYRHGHLPLHRIHLFLTFDFLTKVYNLGFHLFVGLSVFQGQHTVFVTVRIKEVLG